MLVQTKHIHMKSFYKKNVISRKVTTNPESSKPLLNPYNTEYLSLQDNLSLPPQKIEELHKNFISLLKLKTVFTTSLFLFSHKYNIKDFFLADVNFLYTIKKNGYYEVISITKINHAYTSNEQSF